MMTGLQKLVGTYSFQRSLRLKELSVCTRKLPPDQNIGWFFRFCTRICRNVRLARV